jgi:uncharacterized Zn-binding protein involved in type VI secretion
LIFCLTTAYPAFLLYPLASSWQLFELIDLHLCQSIRVPAAAAAAIQSAKQASDATIQAAEAVTLANAGSPSLPAAKAAEEATKAAAATAMSSTITSGAGGADIHMCATSLPPHGPGVVVDGSTTVLINGLPACRQGDTIIEALGPPNKIMMGCPMVLIGG